MFKCPDHPDIVSIERTGYPSWFKTGQSPPPDEDAEYDRYRDDLLEKELGE